MLFRSFFDFFLDDIEEIWIKRGGGPEIKDILIKKLDECKKYGIKGLTMFENKHPVGFGWVDVKTPHYGNIILHTIDPKYDEILAKSIIQLGYFNDVLLELIQFREELTFPEILISQNITQIERFRMGMRLDYGYDYPEIREGVTFSPLTPADIMTSSRVSYKAHKVSEDYLAYPDLNDPQKRIELEKKVFEGIYGPVIDAGSLLLK